MRYELDAEDSEEGSEVSEDVGTAPEGEDVVGVSWTLGVMIRRFTSSLAAEDISRTRSLKEILLPLI
jgi:hypothetical protein